MSVYGRCLQVEIRHCMCVSSIRAGGEQNIELETGKPPYIGDPPDQVKGSLNRGVFSREVSDTKIFLGNKICVSSTEVSPK